MGGILETIIRVQSFNANSNAAYYEGLYSEEHTDHER